MRPAAAALRRSFAALAVALVASSAGPSGPAAAGAERSIALSYVITLAGVHIGDVRADGRFNETGYAVTLTGVAGGISRLMTDASAWMAANGNIRGTEVLPARFEIGMDEGGVAAEAEMRLADRAVMDLHVVPGLAAGLDIVPLTLDHVRGVVDPMSALFVPVADPARLSGAEACNRTLAVFDGWQRYDIEMFFRGAETVFGARAAYAGPAFVCGARYRPVAGHSLTRPSVRFMSVNSRLEAWLIPAGDLGILVPFKLLIGTELGDLVIQLERLSVG